MYAVSRNTFYIEYAVRLPDKLTWVELFGFESLIMHEKHKDIFFYSKQIRILIF